MSTLKISKHSDVPAALDLVCEEGLQGAMAGRSGGFGALGSGSIERRTSNL